VTWVTTRGEKVAGARVPASVELIAGANLDDLIGQGVIDAKFIDDHGQDPDPRYRRLWADPEREIARWYRTAGYFPVLHTVVVRNSVLAAHPEVAAELCRRLEAAKMAALVKYDFGASLPAAQHAISLRAGFPGATRNGADRGFLGPDPIPYGLEINRPTLERLVRYARDQRAISSAPDVTDLFTNGYRELKPSRYLVHTADIH
jgi:4,5-dihydroxyphthalate decarboxylase